MRPHKSGENRRRNTHPHRSSNGLPMVCVRVRVIVCVRFCVWTTLLLLSRPPELDKHLHIKRVTQEFGARFLLANISVWSDADR